MLDRNLSVYPLIQILSRPLKAHFCEILFKYSISHIF